MCGHPSSSMAFKSSESCKILNHNNDNVNKNQKKNCTRKIMPILCMPQAQYGENYEHNHVVKNVHLVWTLKWNKRV
jgi:hypothetical protein